MRTAGYARESVATPLDLDKYDTVLVLGGRTFAVRAYLDRRASDGPGWHVTIVENRTILSHALVPTEDPAACLDAAVRYLTAFVSAAETARALRAPEGATVAPGA
jgi:hypothetical protein